MKLLIADDHPVNRTLLRSQLETEGHEVIEARNGADAMQLLKGEHVDGVVSDILMPEMDGYRLCLEVRQDVALHSLPFVLYTSTYNSPADRQLATLVGADAYIPKPAPTAVILDALRQAALKPAHPEVRRFPESDVLRQYNEALVRKLEEKNLELEDSLERIARLSRIQSMLTSIDSAILRIRNREALLAEACRVAVQHGVIRMAWIADHDPATGVARAIAWSGFDGSFLQGKALNSRVTTGEGGGVGGAALRARKVVVENDLAAHTGDGYARAEALQLGCRSAIGVPLMTGGQPVAVFMLYAAEVGFFTAEEVRLLEWLAADLSFALEHIAKTDRLNFLAYHDVLTGLPNRRLFHDRLGHSLQARAGESVLIAVALLDLERFQRVNETLGRQAGDELLHVVGSRLQQASDTAARIGTDVFALSLRGARTAAEVNRALEAIVAACLSEPFQLHSQELRIACRVGVALYPADGHDADSLLRNAEAALRLGKRNSEHLVFYAPEMNARVAEALATETRLRRALERHEFVLHYQPKVTIADGRIVGVEALIRWQDPDKGLVPPDQFIPVLEETGMISEVGGWVVLQALTDHAAWATCGFALPNVAVNVSSIQLQRNDFVETMIDVVQRAGDNAEALQLEVTESLLMRDVEASSRKLSILRGLGMKVAVDDFGTGYSSLSHIARLPIDTVKIDRSFISGITASAEDATIVAGIIALVRSLELRVVAEGVETVEQAQHLAGLGCDEAQGFFYSRPVPAAQIETLMHAGGVLPMRNSRATHVRRA